MPKVCTRCRWIVLVLMALAVMDAQREARAWIPDPTPWGPWQPGSGWHGAYASASRTRSGWVVFSNLLPPRDGWLCPGKACPGIVRYDGPSLVDPRIGMRARVVFRNTAIDDLRDAEGQLVADRMLTRVVVVPDPVDGTWHAVVHVSDGYGPRGGPVGGRVEPAYLTSRNGRRWIYHGRLGGEVGEFSRSRPYWGSSMALVVNPHRGEGVESKLVFAMDGVLPDGGLVLAVSNDGERWSFLRDEQGRLRNIAPPEVARERLIFPSMVRVGRVWRMVAADGWPPTRHRHMVSCDGLRWTLLGDPSGPSPTYVPPVTKNATLATDGRTLHALVGGWVRSAPWVDPC